jgi:hypothetical protein
LHAFGFAAPAVRTCVRLLTILILLAVIVSAQSGSDFRTLPWELIVGAAVLAAYMVVAFAYMIGEGFSLPEMRGWAANEAYQVTAVLVIVVLVFITVRIENSVFESFGFSPSPTNPNPSIVAGEQFLDASREYLISVASAGYSSNMFVIAALKKIKISTNFIDFSDAIEQLHRTAKDMIGIAVGGIHISIGLMTAQRWFLDLIARSAFTIFLPLGILLRTFTFSRGIGAFFIAIAISFYIVYPLTFLFDQKVVDTLLCPENVQHCDGLWKNIREIRLPALSKAVSLNSIDGSVGELAEGAASGFVGTFTVLFSEAAFAFTTFTLLTIMNFVITAGVTRSISNLMGYDIRMGDIIKIL